MDETTVTLFQGAFARLGKGFKGSGDRMAFHRVCSVALVCLVGTSAGYASSQPPEGGDVHYCQPLHFEEIHERDSIYAAGKQALNLNVGPPRTVRMIYFLPNDRLYRASVVDSMKSKIRQIQRFYGEQMEAHGYGYKTFDIETDAEGEPMVHRVDGQHPVSHYLDIIYRTGIDEVEAVFDIRQNVYLIVVDRQGGGGIGNRYGKIGGQAWILGRVDFIVAAHELGHAFGLAHDFRDNEYIMSYGLAPRSLSACHADFLAVHPYFNPGVPVEGDDETGFSGTVSDPHLELTSSQEYPERSSSMPIRLRVSDSEGVHQVLLFVRTRQPHAASGLIEVKACRSLEGQQNATIAFDYDGVIPSGGTTSLSNPPRHEVYIQAVDTEGNRRGVFFPLIEISGRLIGTLSHTDRITSVAYSPDGTMLASGSNGGTVKLWNMATRTDIGTFGNGRSVAFSPDGTMLVTGGTAGGTIGTVRLWDLTTREQISSLRHGRWVESVAFSPDGTTVASGSQDGTIYLWNAATSEHIGTLAGHTGWVRSLTFSPNGKTIASGAFADENGIRLWDVATRKHIATLSDPDVRIGGDVWSVSLSPDGTTIASASSSGYVPHLLNLWDAATREHAATLYNGIGGPQSVSFSPDGTTLASGHRVGTINLWDVATREHVATLAGHVHLVTSVAFSPDGQTLASGSEDYTIRLWDVSEWTSRAATVETTPSGILKGKKLLVDTVINAGEVNDGVNTIAPSMTMAGDTVKVELFVEDGGGNKTNALDAKFAARLGETMIEEGWQIVAASTEVYVLQLKVGPDVVRVGALPAADIPANGYIGTVNIVAGVDAVEGVSFYVKSAVIGLADGSLDSLDVSEAIITVEVPKVTTANFSISLDGDNTTGNQGVTTLDVATGAVVPIQLYGNGIRSVEGVSARFEYDADQVGYVGFDAGDVLPNAQVLAVPGTNPTAIDISVVSFGGNATADSGLVGSIRFSTTDAFSGTTLDLVSAEIGRGDHRESITLTDAGITLRLAQLSPDFNGDGRVDFGDFLEFGNRFGARRGDQRYEAKYDLDRDGTIGFGDFLIFGQEFGSTV